MRRLRLSWVFLCCPLLAPGAVPAPVGDPPVKVQKLTYAKLADLLYQNRGKVVVVDLWNLGCPPCIQAMPHLVELHHKHSAKGLLVVSLNVDDLGDEDNVADIRKILTKKKLGDITNVMLDEDKNFWRKKFDIVGVPCVFIFDRDGKWHKYSDTALVKDGLVNVEMIDAVVKQLLDQPVKGVK